MSSLQRNLELGRERLGQGDYLGALTYADAALALDTASFEALQLRSRALYLLGRDADALQTLRRAHAVLQQFLPEMLERTPFAAEPGEHETITGSMPFGTDALETLLALRERHPLDSELIALLATLAEDAGRFEIARDAYYELVAREPNRIEAWEGLVHILCHEDLDAALEAIARAQTQHPAHALFYEFLGFIHYRRRRFRRAIIAYRQAIEHGAEHPDNDQALIECYLELGEIESALELMRALASRKTNDPEVYRFIVEVALQCQNFAMAMEHAHQLVRLQPTHAETYCYKAWVEIAQDEWPDAERSLRLGFHKAVDGVFALFELAEILLTDREFAAALRVADLAAELAPEHPETYASRGKILRETGELTDALAAFQQAAVLAPQDDAYQTWIGIVLDNLEDYQGAMQQYNHVLARHPADVWTLSNRGLTYLALGMHEQALTDFRRAIEIDPQDASLYFWRACTLVKLSEIDQAFRDLQRAVDFSDEIITWLEQEPALIPLHHDPRFRELLNRLSYEG